MPSWTWSSGPANASTPCVADRYRQGLARCIRVRIGNEIFRFEQPEIEIGSSPSSHLVLPHDSVAPRHATLKLDPSDSSCVVTATNLRAVLVNGEQTLARNVYEGDLIHIGGYRIVVLEREPVPAAEQVFLDRLAAEPGDEATRHVYADWLEEHARDADAKLSPTLRRLLTNPPIEHCPKQCSLRWNDLAPTDDGNIRRCGECFDYVHYARSIDEAQMHASLHRRVAVDVTLLRKDGDLDRPPTGHYRTRESPPFALVLRPPDPVDLPAPIARV